MRRRARGLTALGVVVGESFAARALGDLNCDGALSTFERVGTVDAEGDVDGGPGICKKDPLE